MKATIRDREVLHSIRPLDLVTYLRSRGWMEAQRIESGIFWSIEKEGRSHEVLVPLDSQLRDFTTRIAEVLRILEDAEDRSQIEIVDDLTVQNADVVRPRLRGATEDGSITLEQGMVLHARARDMMLAAACAALGPRSLYARRKPEQAMDYLNRARFGLAKRGSYIMSIISPVTPQLISETDLLGHPIDLAEPFERRTMRMLALGLNAVVRACTEVAATGNMDAMRAAVSNGVSANLCEAIVGLDAGGGGQGIDFSFVWAPSRRAPTDVTSTVVLLPDAIPIIAETAKIFRETATVENIEVVGTVQRLQHIMGRQGDVTIFGMADGLQRTVHIQLTGLDHTNAVQAYESRRPVSCVGRLVREGWSWRLVEPRDFNVLNELI